MLHSIVCLSVFLTFCCAVPLLKGGQDTAATDKTITTYPPLLIPSFPGTTFFPPNTEVPGVDQYTTAAPVFSTALSIDAPAVITDAAADVTEDPVEIDVETVSSTISTTELTDAPDSNDSYDTSTTDYAVTSTVSLPAEDNSDLIPYIQCKFDFQANDS